VFATARPYERLVTQRWSEASSEPDGGNS
jgi:hypothetical protein